jgi:hypothetical protein
VEKESLFNFAANKKTANAGYIGSLIFFEKRKMVALHGEGKSNQAIKEELKISLSRQHIWRLIKTYKEKIEKEIKAFEAVLIEQS